MSVLRLKKQVAQYLRKNSFKPSIDLYVPKHSPIKACDVAALERYFDVADKILVVTGAGISTESGIPDYRSEEVGLYARSTYRPVQFQEFLQSASVRQRYWARNYVGWSKFSQNEPNVTHYVLQILEKLGKINYIITQNVDSLHYKAGSKKVIELHGTAYNVVCLGCGKMYSRHHIQNLLSQLNPDMQNTKQIVRPDGDVDIDLNTIKSFMTPFCEHCSGILKPDIVFFGDNVPKARLQNVKQEVDACDSLLVLGSSLNVFSGYRIALEASELNKKIAIVNIGPTRADKLANLKVSAKCGDILIKVFE